MTTGIQPQMSITDLFGNIIEVTDLAAAIAEREMCVAARVEFFTAPFTLTDGVKATTPGRETEKFTLANYHEDLLAKLLTLQQLKAST
jgi:hypothetical protein